MRVIIEDRKIDGIPVLELFDLDDATPKPVVLILHGLGGCKESNFREAYRLVREGFFVSMFDAYGHGEWRQGTARQLTKMERVLDLPNIISKTVEMMDTLIANYRHSDRANDERVGLLGRSMGGMIVYAYLTEDCSPYVKAAVPMVATSAWTKLDHVASDAMALYNADQLRWFAEHEPCRRLRQLPDFPLLMLNGVDDPKMPIAGVRVGFREIQKYYSIKDRVRLVEYEGVGHEVTADMITEAIAWFKKYL
jgi:dienelactone hydrolase